MSALPSSGAAADPPPPPDLAWRGLLLAWAAFWALMLVLAVQEHVIDQGRAWWKPVLWEGSSMVVASALMAWQWRRVPRLDDRLARPLAWFARALVTLPLAAVVFVATVHLIRVAVHHAAGETYLPGPWAGHLVRELLKFAIFYLLFMSVVFALRSHGALARARWQVERQQSLLRQAQLQQLTRQVEPHFLFNTLNMLAELVHVDAVRAEHLLLRLARLMRAATDLTGQPVQPLAEELALVQAYADLMGERFAGRVTLDVRVPAEARACPVPTLGLQVLLENAYRHGVEAQGMPVRILLGARLAEGRLQVWVHDDAGRLDPGARFGTGLGNLQQRLHALHGDAARLVLEAAPEGGTRATMELPCAC